jgi:hypothetical protein
MTTETMVMGSLAPIPYNSRTIMRVVHDVDNHALAVDVGYLWASSRMLRRAEEVTENHFQGSSI